MFIIIVFVGLPPRYRDSVRAITPGLPLFLYNYTTHQLHGIFEVSSLSYLFLLYGMCLFCCIPAKGKFTELTYLLNLFLCVTLMESRFDIYIAYF